MDNLIFLVDWNDFGIDQRPASSVVHGDPRSWFEPYGWQVVGTDDGMEWEPVTRTVLEVSRRDEPRSGPAAAWFKTRKGRGYGKFDAASHGTPHPLNSPEFWSVRKRFMELYGVTYDGVDEPAPTDPEERAQQAAKNFQTAIGVLRRDTELVTYLSDRLLQIASSVPDEVEGFNLAAGSAKLFSDKRLTDFHSYPSEMFKLPGDRQPNRAALAAWGSWVNSFARSEYGRPLFIASSADLADSTNLSGFGKGWGDTPGWGWYDRLENPSGTVLPQEITEFTNAGISVGLASVNLAADPFRDFDGFWAACSTYGSFSYLKYGEMRLFSQLAQDCELRVGKVLWIAGHSGPETAEDSRTHFGIFSPGVTQLFPAGHVIDLHPWEYNEVPVVLAAALASPAPIIALHLTRPPVEIPDRPALAIPSHEAAARGAYLIRDFRAGKPRQGTVFVRGTLPTANLLAALPQIDRAGYNLKIVAAISPQLFALQDSEYREATVSPADKLDSMAITNGALRLMGDWISGPFSNQYSLSPDWDDRWRTGGSVDEVMDEAHLTSAHILEALERFVTEHPRRIASLQAMLKNT